MNFLDKKQFEIAFEAAKFFFYLALGKLRSQISTEIHLVAFSLVAEINFKLENQTALFALAIIK